MNTVKLTPDDDDRAELAQREELANAERALRAIRNATRRSMKHNPSGVELTLAVPNLDSDRDLVATYPSSVFVPMFELDDDVAKVLGRDYANAVRAYATDLYEDAVRTVDAVVDAELLSERRIVVNEALALRTSDHVAATR